VDDPVPDGIRAPELRQHLVEPGGVGAQVRGVLQLVVGAEQSQLQAARARVDDEDPQNGQTQSRTWSGSSPCSRV
jgi:hypothetical protein